MQIEFAVAATVAAAVAPRKAWHIRGARRGRGVTSMTVALPEEACPRLGHDDQNGGAHGEARVATPSGSADALVARTAGTHVACDSRGARAVFVAVRKVLAHAAVNGGEAEILGPIQGVMAYGVCAAGRKAGRARVAANVTGS